MSTKKRIVIEIEEGIINKIYTEEPLDILVIDHDEDVVNPDDEFWMTAHDEEVNSEEVQKKWEAYKEE